MISLVPWKSISNVLKRSLTALTVRSACPADSCDRGAAFLTWNVWWPHPEIKLDTASSASVVSSIETTLSLVFSPTSSNHFTFRVSYLPQRRINSYIRPRGPGLSSRWLQQFHDLHFGATLGRNKSNKKRWVTQKVIRCHPLKLDNGCFGTAISFQIKRRFVEYPFLKFCLELSWIILMAPNSLYKHPESSKQSPNESKSTCHLIKPNNSERMSHSKYQTLSNSQKINQDSTNQLNQDSTNQLNQSINQPTQPTSQKFTQLNQTAPCLSINRLSKF